MGKKSKAGAGGTLSALSNHRRVCPVCKKNTSVLKGKFVPHGPVVDGKLVVCEGSNAEVSHA